METPKRPPRIVAVMKNGIRIVVLTKRQAASRAAWARKGIDRAQPSR